MGTIFDDLEQRRVEQDRHRENTARLAQAYAKFTSTGTGTMEFETRVDFDMTFTEEPFIAYGSFCDIDAVGDLQGVTDDDDALLPLSSGYVTEWDQDARGFYTGCWCAVRVSFPMNDMQPGDLPVVIHHHFTFSAVAMKDIPGTLTD